MTIDSFRDYLDLLDKTGTSVAFEESVSWDLEASAVTMLANLNDGPVPVFESVTAVDSEAKLVGDPIAGRGPVPGTYWPCVSGSRTACPAAPTTTESLTDSIPRRNHRSSTPNVRPAKQSCRRERT